MTPQTMFWRTRGEGRSRGGRRREEETSHPPEEDSGGKKVEMRGLDERIEDRVGKEKQGEGRRSGVK